MAGVRLGSVWIAVVLVCVCEAQDVCEENFVPGKEDFVLNTDESVKEGATFLGSPSVSRVRDCLRACCKEPGCNLALMEDGPEQGTINSCFIFNCLYKQKKVCRFVKKRGFDNYVLKSVYKDYFEEQESDEEDKPPVANAGQDRVVQPHDDVTLNGIESKDDKKIVTFHWEQVSGNQGIIMSKTHFEDAVTISNLSAGMYKFRLTVMDDADQTDSAEVSVLVLTPEQSLHHCLVPKKEGPCRGSYPRWHYNAANEKCEEFKFGGCRPNRNNYLTLNECRNACDKVSVNVPSPSGRFGPVHTDSAQCDEACGAEHFTCSNNCCIDKELECDGVSQCSDGSDEAECSNLKTTFRRLIEIPLDKAKAHCVEPPVTGTCRASFTNWYYNPYERRCSRFNYGGCEGNDNRFESEDKCMNSCSSVTETDAFARKGEFEKQVNNSDTVSVAIAVLLGIGIAILLIVLGVCLLKGKKKRRNKNQHVAVNGGHVHAFEDSEKLVYNNTTRPI